MKEEKMEVNKNISGINYSPKNPFSLVEYRHGLDNSSECTEYQVHLSQNLIGLLSWIIHIVRIDIVFKLLSPTKYLSNQINGHLIQALHVFK